MASWAKMEMHGRIANWMAAVDQISRFDGKEEKISVDHQDSRYTDDEIHFGRPLFDCRVISSPPPSRRYGCSIAESGESREKIFGPC